VVVVVQRELFVLSGSHRDPQPEVRQFRKPWKAVRGGVSAASVL